MYLGDNRISLTKDHKLTIHGVTYGTSKPEYWHSLPTDLYSVDIEAYKKTVGRPVLLVVKIPGGQHWGDRIRGQVYHGATFNVFEVLRHNMDVNEERYFDCRQLIDFPIRK